MEPALAANVPRLRGVILANAARQSRVRGPNGCVSVTTANSVDPTPLRNPVLGSVVDNRMPAVTATICANNITTAAKITTKPAYVNHLAPVKSAATTDVVEVAARAVRVQRVMPPGNVKRRVNPIAPAKPAATTVAAEVAAPVAPAPIAPMGNVLPSVRLPA